MTRWEHIKVNVNEATAKDADVALLNELGREPGELVTITPNHIAYLKRRVEEPAPPAKRARRRVSTNYELRRRPNWKTAAAAMQPATMSYALSLLCNCSLRNLLCQPRVQPGE